MSGKVNIGDLSFYSGGFALPPGDYCLYFDCRIHAFTKNDGTRGQERLGVMMQAFPLAGGEPQEQFMSMGSKAHLSFAPDPEDGKGLVALPNAPSGSLAGLTNWNTFLKSLYDCGMPEGTFTNDLTAIDGIWVSTGLIDEPEGRKSLGAKTGVVEEEQRTPGKIPVVTEIKDDGMPWNGTGGLPEGYDQQAQAPAPAPKPKPGPKAPPARPGAPAPKAAPKAPPAAAPKPGPRPVPRPAPAAPVAASTTDADAVGAAASAGAAAVLAKFPAGTTRLILRTGTFKAVKETEGDDMGNVVLNTYFQNDDDINALIALHGYQVNAAGQVLPAQ